MGEWLMGLTVALIFFYGWWVINRERRRRHMPVVYLVVKDQEEIVEGIIRLTVKVLEKRKFVCSLVFLVEKSRDQTLEVTRRLAGSLSYTFREIDSLQEWEIKEEIPGDSRICLLDVRGQREFSRKKFRDCLQILKHQEEEYRNKTRLKSRT